MAMIEHSTMVPSPGLSVLMFSSAGSYMLEQSSVFGVSLDDFVGGERYAGEQANPEEDGTWAAFVVAAFEPDAKCP